MERAERPESWGAENENMMRSCSGNARYVDVSVPGAPDTMLSPYQLVSWDLEIYSSLRLFALIPVPYNATRDPLAKSITSCSSIIFDPPEKGSLS